MPTDEDFPKQVSPHRLLENLTYVNNLCKSLKDKLKHYEGKLESLQVPAPKLEKIIASLKEEQVNAYSNRIAARAAIDELFASLRG